MSDAPSAGEMFDGTEADVLMSDEVRAAALERIAAAVAKYGPAAEDDD